MSFVFRGSLAVLLLLGALTFALSAEEAEAAVYRPLNDSGYDVLR